MSTFLIIIGALVAITIAAALLSRTQKQPQDRAFDGNRDWAEEAKRLQAKHSAGLQRTKESAPATPHGRGGELPPPPDRPDAVKAFACAVVGESHRNPDGSSRQDIIRQFVVAGQAATLRREPDNKHDPNAIAVLYSGRQIGYLKRDVAGRLVKYLDNQAFRAEALVLAVHGGTPEKPSLGVTLDLGIYKNAPN